MTGTWKTFEEASLSRESFAALLENRIPALRIRDFATLSECAAYAPTAGDVVLFNARNPHEVAGGPADQGRDRIGIGSFIGRMPDRSLMLWS